MAEPRVTIAFQTDKPITAYGPLAATVEDYGFDGASVYNDLLYQPGWLPLLEMARATDRLRLGVASVNPFTCHPINIAGNIALIDELAGGRTYLGFSRGAWLDFLGLAPERPIRALREAMACVRHLLRRSPEPLAGEFFPLTGGDSLRWPVPRADIPFLLGSWGVRTARACLPYVDEIKLGGSANPAVVPWFRQAIGRDDVAIAVGAVTVVAEDGAAARAWARREAALYLPVVAELDGSLAVDPELLARVKQAAERYDFDGAARLIPDDILRRFAFAGTPDEVAEQAAELFAAGADRVEFGTPHGLTAEQGLRLLGERVLPALRSR